MNLPCEYPGSALLWSWTYNGTIHKRNSLTQRSIFECMFRERNERSHCNDMAESTLLPRRCSDICDILLHWATNWCRENIHHWYLVSWMVDSSSQISRGLWGVNHSLCLTSVRLFNVTSLLVTDMVNNITRISLLS
jgi:hypothetical protein